MPLNLPSADFVTTTLNGAISAGSSTATIGTSLPLAATNGILQIDYANASGLVIPTGTDNGPETLYYSSYVAATGALTGLTRGRGGTFGVAHGNGAYVQAGLSIDTLGPILPLLIGSAWSVWNPTLTGFSGSPSSLGVYQQIGKTVFVNGSIAGTSNSAAFGFNLPAAPLLSNNYPVRVENNGTYAMGIMQTTGGSVNVQMYVDLNGTTAFATTGIKGIDFGSLIYQAQ